MSQRWRGKPKPNGWENYSYTLDRVSEREPLVTISCGGCWCGLPHNHDWPGRDQGAPHPREEAVNAVTTWESKQKRTQQRRATEEVLKHSQMKKFPRAVRDLVLSLVNEHGIEYRMQADGQHLHLYNGVQGTRPYKVSAAVRENVQINSLTEWLATHFPDIDPEASKKKEQTPQALFRCGYGCDEAFPTPEEINAHYAEKHEDTPEEEQDVTITEDPPVIEENESDIAARAVESEGITQAQQAIDARIAFEEPRWVPYVWPGTGKDSTCIVTDGKTFKCTHGDYESESAVGLFMHEAKHTGELDEIRVKATASAAENRERKKAARLDALNVLAERDGFVVFSKEDAARLKKSKDLLDENARLQARVDDLETKMALAKEAFGL